MGKDLIIGYASGYTFDQLKPWVNSIKASGFTGDISLLSNSLDKETSEKLASLGVSVRIYNTGPGIIAPHVIRFFYLWETLRGVNAADSSYDKVLVTDTRDVVFQKNPSEYLKTKNTVDLISTSEGLAYKDEAWNKGNLYQSFGPYFYDLLKDEVVQNVGVFAGTPLIMEGLMLFIYQLSLNRPIPVVDQAVFNLIMNTEPYYSGHLLAEEEFCCNLGTTLLAAESGAGDIGLEWMKNPKAKEEYLAAYKLGQPKIKDGKVLTSAGKEYFILHQWDRVPEIKEMIEKNYV